MNNRDPRGRTLAGGREGETDRAVYFEGCGSLTVGCTGRGSPQSLSGAEGRASILSYPTPKPPANTHIKEAAFLTPQQGWNLGWGWGAGTLVSVLHRCQDLLNYRKEFVQILPSPEPPPSRLPSV